MSLATDLKRGYEADRRRVDRAKARRAAVRGCPLKRGGRGRWLTLDEKYEIQWHPQHRMWFISANDDSDGRSPYWANEWYETLWEVRRDLIQHDPVPQPRSEEAE